MFYNVGTMKYPRDLTGIKFGSTEPLYYGEGDTGGMWWWCKCDCGKEFPATRQSLVQGHSRSCGCQRKHSGGKQKGCNPHIVNGKPDLTAVSFYCARTRCNNPKTINFHNYGGRGIEFRFKSIDELIEAIGERPSSEYSINRIDNDGHYEKGNVEWATDKEQSRNWRKSKRQEVGGFRIDSEPCRLIHLGGKDWLIVDAKNYERMSLRVWHKYRADSGQLYAKSSARSGEYQAVFAQRFVMNATPDDRIKFRNGNGFDVRESNLYIHGEFGVRKERQLRHATQNWESV